MPMNRVDRSAVVGLFVAAALLFSTLYLVSHLSVVMAQAQAQPASTTPVPPKFEPTEIQRLRLENAQLRAVNAQTVYLNRAQQLPEFANFQSLMNALYRVCEEVRSENKWPTDVKCDVDKNPIPFAQQATPATPAPAPPAPPAAPSTGKK